MAQFKPPDNLNFDNPKWEEWKKSFEAFSLITELKEKNRGSSNCNSKILHGN